MIIYVHRDSIYENQTIGSWGIPIFKYLRKKGKNVKIIDAHDFDVVKNLNPNDDDLFFGRFGHDVDDKRLSQATLPFIWNKFKKSFPSKSSYFYYDDKHRQYAFMKNNSIPCLKTFYVKDKDDVDNSDLNFPIVMKKTWGAGSEQVKYFETLDDVIDDDETRGWTQQSIYPSLIQEYQDIDFDYRVMVYKSGFIIYKRLNEWKTKNKDNFPYGTEWRERKDILKLRKSVAHAPKLVDAFDELNDELLDLILHLKKIQVEKLDTYFTSWDIIKTKNEYKVLEFSVTSSMHNPFDKFYDFETKKILQEFNNPVLHRNGEFRGITKLLQEYLK